MNTERQIQIRPAKVAEAQGLTELALRSKSIWGYDKTYLRNCREALTLQASDIQNWPVHVCEINNLIVGFCALKHVDGEDRLDHLWIEPKYIKQGIGSHLFSIAIVEAQKLGWPLFRLAADPPAKGFYEKMGAECIGTVQSRIKPDLLLPHMEFELPEAKK